MGDVEWITLKKRVTGRNGVEGEKQMGVRKGKWKWEERRKTDWQRSSGELQEIEMQMGKYSVKLSYLSASSQSPVSNFTLFTLLYFFLHFFLFLSFISFIFPLSSSFIVYIVPPPPSSSLSVSLFPPCSCLSLRSKLHVAVNLLAGKECVSPPEQQSSARAEHISLLRSYYTSCLWLRRSGASKAPSVHLWKKIRV